MRFEQVLRKASHNNMLVALQALDVPLECGLMHARWAVDWGANTHVRAKLPSDLLCLGHSTLIGRLALRGVG